MSVEYVHKYPDDCEYNKLVRDKVPEIIEAAGLVAHCHSVDHVPLMESILQKIVEEVEEVKVELNRRDGDKLESELGDLFEVIYAIEEHFPQLMRRVHELRLEKKDTHGGFSNAIFLERTAAK